MYGALWARDLTCTAVVPCPLLCMADRRKHSCTATVPCPSSPGVAFPTDGSVSGSNYSDPWPSSPRCSCWSAACCPALGHAVHSRPPVSYETYDRAINLCSHAPRVGAVAAQRRAVLSLYASGSTPLRARPVPRTLRGLPRAGVRAADLWVVLYRFFPGRPASKFACEVLTVTQWYYFWVLRILEFVG